MVHCDSLFVCLPCSSYIWYYLQTFFILHLFYSFCNLLLASSCFCTNLSLIIYYSTWKFYHHHERAPGWSVAVSTSCLHRSLSFASRHAELSPWLSGWRSAFRVQSQVWRGRPGRRLQSLGSPQVDICRALKVSYYSLNKMHWMLKLNFG